MSRFNRWASIRYARLISEVKKDTEVSSAVDVVKAAPEALDTLEELAAALNNDANFASTVTNALSAKANSADLATVSRTGSYNDLANKPIIPTGLSAVATSGSYDDLTDVPDLSSSLNSIGTDTELYNVIKLDASTGNWFVVDSVSGEKQVSISNVTPDISEIKLVVKDSSTGTVGLYDPATRTSLSSLTGTIPGYTSVDVHPDGVLFFFQWPGSNPVYRWLLGTAWDISTNTQTISRSLHVDRTTGNWYDGGKRFGGVRTNNTIHVANAAGTYWFNSGSLSSGGIATTWSSGSDGNMRSSYINRASTYANGAWSSDSWLVVGSTTGKVVLFNQSVGSTRLSEATFTGGAITAIFLSPDGKRLTIAQNTNGISIYLLSTPLDLTTATLETTISGTYNLLTYSYDGTKFIYGTTGTSAGIYVTEVGTIGDPVITGLSTDVALSVGSPQILSMASVDGGATYQLVGGSSGSGGSGGSGGGSGGLVLGEYHAVCNGSLLKDVATRDVTGVQNLSTSYVDATGSKINGITVPSGTKKIIYEYNVMIGWVDAHAISHWKLFYSTNGTTWTEVVDARRNPVSGQYSDGHNTLSWPFEIAADTADTASGKLTTTDSDTYYFKWQVREYSTSNEMKLHTTQYWDGGGTDMFCVPTVSIKFLS